MVRLHRIVPGIVLCVLLAAAPVSLAQPAGGTTHELADTTVSASGNTTIIAGVAAKVIRVKRFEIFCNGANNVTLKDTAGAVLRATRNLGAGQGWINDWSDYAWYTTGTGAGLVLNLSTTQACNVTAVYTQG